MPFFLVLTVYCRGYTSSSHCTLLINLRKRYRCAISSTHIIIYTSVSYKLSFMSSLLPLTLTVCPWLAYEMSQETGVLWFVTPVSVAPHNQWSQRERTIQSRVLRSNISSLTEFLIILCPGEAQVIESLDASLLSVSVWNSKGQGKPEDGDASEHCTLCLEWSRPVLGGWQQTPSHPRHRAQSPCMQAKLFSSSFTENDAED